MRLAKLTINLERGSRRCWEWNLQKFYSYLMYLKIALFDKLGVKALFLEHFTRQFPRRRAAPCPILLGCNEKTDGFSRNRQCSASHQVADRTI